MEEDLVNKWFSFCEEYRLSGGIMATGAGQLSYMQQQKLNLADIEATISLDDYPSEKDLEAGEAAVKWLRVFLAQFN